MIVQHGTPRRKRYRLIASIVVLLLGLVTWYGWHLQTQRVSSPAEPEQADTAPREEGAYKDFERQISSGTKLAFPAETTFPARFDLRDHGRVTPVRSMEISGPCWAFAATASLESCLLPKERLLFSPRHMANWHGYNKAFDVGGDVAMATGYLVRWGIDDPAYVAGPLFEKDDPYSTEPPKARPAIPVRRHVQNVLWIPRRADAADNANIKYALTQYGAVVVGMRWDDKALHPTNGSYYFALGAGGGHILTIVGWDDRYPAEKFVTPAPGPGAFICKNSWGTAHGDKGYVYISYHDPSLARTFKVNGCFFNAEPTSNYARCYQYDPLGLIGTWGGLSDAVWMAAVYEAKANESLAAFGTYCLAPNTDYELSVYLDPDDGPIHAGEAQYRQSGRIVHPGFWTIPLQQAVSLNKGQKFSVVVKVTAPDLRFPIPIEAYNLGRSEQASSNPGETWVRLDKGPWHDVATLPDVTNGSVCLKAYTRDR